MQDCKLKVLELFGGIGACTKALKRLGINFEVVDYVEINKYAVNSYNAMNGTNFKPQDISRWNKDIQADLIMHGSPCQDFSLAGNQAGGDEGSGTRSSLMYETIRIIDKLKPKYVIWENVRNLLSKRHIHNFYAYLRKLEEFGYKNYYQILNSKDYEIPQNRERVFTISILNNSDFYFPKKKDLKLKLKDLLEDEVEEKYYLNESVVENIIANFECNDFTKILIRQATKKGYAEAYEGDSINFEQPNSKTRRGRVGKGIAQTLLTSCQQGVVVENNGKPICLNSKGGRNGIKGLQPSLQNRVYSSSGSSVAITTSHHPSYTDKTGLRIRKLTPLECWRLMGFDDEDFCKAKQHNSNVQLYKQAGNSIVVNVLEAILTNLLIEKTIEQNYQLSIYDYL